MNGPDRNEERLKVMGGVFSMGVYIHVYIRNSIASLCSFSGIEEDDLMNHLNAVVEKFPVEDDWRLNFDYRKCEGKDTKGLVFHLKGGVTVFKKENNEVEIIYDRNSDRDLREKLIHDLNLMVDKPVKRQIGIIHNDGLSLDVRFIKYRRYEQDLIQYLDESTQAFHREMVDHLSNEEGTGLFLLYGEPGTGKTSFIKSVIEAVDRKTLFITPGMVEQLTSPALISLLTNYPGSILVIEDAEVALMERKTDNSNAVSNLLNMSDGFMADYLNMSIICTFNTEIDNIDPALLREGRLVGRHEFHRLKPDVANKIASALGKKPDIQKSMTMAEICSYGEKDIEVGKKKIGFNSASPLSGPPA